MNAILELEIGPGAAAGTYSVRVIRSVGGSQPTAEFALDVDALLARRALFETTVLSSAVSARRVVSDLEATVQQVGRQLFDAVFEDAVGEAYRTSLAVAQERGTSLQLKLRLTAPKLAALPWESLYDAETGSYLCRKEPLVRNMSAPYTAEPLAIEAPLRILGIIASPRGLPYLDAEAERSRLEQALQSHVDAGLVDLVWLDDVSWNGIHAKLLEQPWHVLHFIGHGGFDAATDEGQLALVGEDGRAEFVTASSLADLLHEAEPTPRLVVLNSCMSGAASEDDLFSGTASALVRSGIHAVAAMQFAISDRAAVAFARGFYTALARGRNIDEAVRSGRIGILGLGSGTLEWVTPVLYLRGDESKIFEISALPPSIVVPPPVPTDRTAAVNSPEPEPDPQPEVGASAPAPVSAPAPPPVPLPAPVPTEPRSQADAPNLEAAPPGAPPPVHDATPEESPEPRGTDQARRRRLVILGAAAGLAAIGLAWWGVAALNGGGDTASEPTSSSRATDPATTPPSTPVAAPTTVTVPVPGNIAWTDVHVACSAGDRLDVLANGTVFHTGTADSGVTPDGLTGEGNHQWNAEGLPDANTVGLIGRVGGAPLFFVGREFHGVCPTDGALELGINDVDVGPNTGAFGAEITLTPVATVISAQTVSVSVPGPADASWTPTEIACTPGEVLLFVASGTVQHGPTPDRRSGPAGTSDFDPAWNVAGLENENHAALIGRLDGQTPFVIGTASEVECPADGHLELGINDNGSGNLENVGSLDVAVIRETQG